MSESKKNKLDLFSFTQKTEPAAAPAKPEPAQAAEAAPEPKKKHSPMSVYVTLEQRQIIEDIAKATGQTKHAVLQYAVRKVCNDWNNKIWPDMEVKPKFK